MQRPDKIARRKRGEELIRKDPDLQNWQIAERLEGVTKDTVARWRREMKKKAELEKQRDTEIGFVNKFEKKMKVRFV